MQNWLHKRYKMKDRNDLNGDMLCRLADYLLINFFCDFFYSFLELSTPPGERISLPRTQEEKRRKNVPEYGLKRTKKLV